MTDAVIEPRESKEVVPATAIARRGAIEGQRQHDIHRIGSADLEREHDPVAHDADDLRRDTVDGNEGADDGRVGPESPPPEGVGQDRHRCRARGFVLGPKGAPQPRRHAQDVVGVRGYECGQHALGIAALPADIDVGRRAGRHRQRLARLGVVEVLGVRQRCRGAPVPPVPHRNQAIGVGIRQRLQKHRVDYAEDRGVGADPEGERQDGNGDEAGIAAHAAEGVADVLGQLRGVLARTDGQQRADVLEPDAQGARGAGRVTLLGAERARHLVAVVGAKVERQEPEEPAEPALARHAGRTLGMSFFARAIPSAVSIRAASARATSRPNVVNR